MRLKSIARVGHGPSHCLPLCLKKRTTAQKAEYAKPLGTFEGVPCGDLKSCADNYHIIAYASLIVAIGSIAMPRAFSGGTTCPRCGYMVNKKAVVCRFCGYPTRTGSPDPSFIWCLNCGKGFFAKLSKCPFCGTGHRLFRKKASKTKVDKQSCGYLHSIHREFQHVIATESLIFLIRKYNAREFLRRRLTPISSGDTH